MAPRAQHCFLIAFLLLATAAADSKACELILHPKGGQDQWTFEGNSGKFTRPEVVTEFNKHLQNGLLPKDAVFNMRDTATREETISVVDLLFFSDNCETLTKVVNWLFPRMNREQLIYAQSVVLIHRKDLKTENFKLPSWYNVFPNYFVPKNVLEDMKKQVKEGTYRADDVPLLVPEGSERWNWLTGDPVLNSLYHSWNLYFPTWMDPAKYDLGSSVGRGEMYYNFHSQLAALYNMYGDPDGPPYVINWNAPIMPGYTTDLSNTAGRRLASRSPEYKQEDSRLHKLVLEMEAMLNETAKNESIPNSNGEEMYVMQPWEGALSVLADIVYGTAQSPNPQFFKSYFDAAVRYLSSLGSNPNEDGGGVSGYSMAALNDPAFYGMVHNVHRLTRFYINYYSEKPDTYNNSMVMTDVMLTGCETNRLETFFEPMTIDVTEAVAPNAAHGEKYKVEKLRLNHGPVRVTLKVNNKNPAPKRIMISLFIFQKINNYIGDIPSSNPVFDRFVTEVPAGESVVTRNFEETHIFVDDTNTTDVDCGIPRRLALPKGTEEGTDIVFFALATPYDEPVPVETGGVSPLCAGRLANFDRPFDFPVDRKADDENALDVTMNSLCSAKVYHATRSFKNGLTL